MINRLVCKESDKGETSSLSSRVKIFPDRLFFVAGWIMKTGSSCYICLEGVQSITGALHRKISSVNVSKYKSGELIDSVVPISGYLRSLSQTILASKHTFDMPCDTGMISAPTKQSHRPQYVDVSWISLCSREMFHSTSLKNREIAWSGKRLSKISL
jgi:hypothetical protein